MSIHIMALVFKSKLGNHAQKLVALKLADFSDDNGVSFPSYQTIAESCEMNRSTVIRHVKNMQQKDIIHIEKRKFKGENSSNIFRLNISKLRVLAGGNLAPYCSKNTVKKVTEKHHPSCKEMPLVVAQCNPKPPYNHQKTTTTDDLHDGGGFDISELIGNFSDEVKQIVSVLPYVKAQAVLDEMSGQLTAGIVHKYPLKVCRALVSSVLAGTFSDDYAKKIVAKRQRREDNEKRLAEAKKSAVQIDHKTPLPRLEAQEVADACRAEIDSLIGTKLKKG